MDGKLIVLCGERPTINEYGERIDEQANLLIKKQDKYFNINGEEIKVDEHKKVINGNDLLNDMMTESTEPDMIFVDWETIIPSNIEPLQEMIAYSRTTQKIPAQIILDSGKNQSIMKRVHMNRLLLIDKSQERPCIDYPLQAMEDFLQLFSTTLEKNGVVSILPTFPNSDDESINKSRLKLIQAWKNKNEIDAKYKGKTLIDVLDPMSYDEFGEIYIKASNEMLNIISKPDWYESEKQGKETEEPGGRD